MNKKVRLNGFFGDTIVILIGTAMYALSVVSFLEPNRISSGGVTGIAILLNFSLGLPTGITMLLLNIPLFVAGLIKFGWRFVLKTAVATVLASIFIDTFSFFFDAFSNDPVISALASGVLMGTGLGIIFLRGASTGGTDIAAKLFIDRFPGMSVGRLMLIFDGIVILSAAVCYRSIESALYSMLSVFVMSRLIDGIMYGTDKGKLVFIVSADSDKMAGAIIEKISRGVTIIPSLGAYTGNRRNLLMCAVRIYEVAKLHKVVKEIDPSAFLVSTEAGEILGEGFRRDF